MLATPQLKQLTGFFATHILVLFYGTLWFSTVPTLTPFSSSGLIYYCFFGIFFPSSFFQFCAVLLLCLTFLQ
jgi:hypothetical protein